MPGLFASLSVIVYKIVLFSYIVGHALRTVRVNERFAPAIYLAFGTAASLATVLYWSAHLLMAKGSIYPFSAIDVGDMGVQMLYASSISTSLGMVGHRNRRALIVSAILAVLNAGLWLVWTGAWVKDILGGLSLWFLLYAVVEGSYVVGSPTMPELRFLAVMSVLITAMQVAALFDVGGWGHTIDTLSSLGWVAGGALLLFRLWHLVRARSFGDQMLCYAFMAHVWFLCAVYLSYEPFYFVVEICSCSMTLPIYLCLLRKAYEQ